MSTTRKLVIVLGAPLVVLGGLGAYWVGQKGSSVVKQVEAWADSLEHSPNPVAMRVAGFPVISHLYVDGERIGRLQTVVVLRNRPGGMDSVRLIADAEVDLAGYASCYFQIDPGALEDSWPLDGVKHVVHCAGDTTGLVPFGSLVFTGVRSQISLYMDRDDVPCADWGGPDRDECDEVRIQVRRLREEIRSEVRSIKQHTKGHTAITVD